RTGFQAERRIGPRARLSLETGPQEGFLPARKLYEAYGFDYCGPFGDYTPNGNSVFMRLELTQPGSA
ncbi:MAG: hypothetical protein AAFY37_11990, partial [Pseudomonadota bacterium]